MKKIINCLSILLLFFSSFTNFAVYAQSKWVVGKTWDKQDFLSEISQWVYQVNFKDITWDNAWTIQGSWIWKENFPSKLVLPKWISLDLNEAVLNSNFEQTDLMKEKIQLLDSRGINYWKLTVDQPEIRVLPDRLQIVKKTTIEYKTENQLKIIRDYIQWDWKTAVSKSKELMLQELNAKLPQLAPKFNQNNIITTINNQKLSQSKNKDIKDIAVDKIPLSIEQDVFLELQKECYLEYWRNNSKCSTQNFQNEVTNATKEITTEEIISFSLIPPTPEQIKSWIWLINIDPKLVRITLNQIENNFEQYWILNQELVSIQNTSSGTNNQIQENPFENANYCEELHYWNQVKINECKALMNAKNNPKEKNYDQKLLNWFTIWKSDRYEFNKTIRINLLLKKIKIFEVWFGFYYSYWFWIRIPISSQIVVNKDVLDDWDNNSSRYNFNIRTSTFDASPADYLAMWIAQNQVFNGNEFVFEFTAWFTYKVRALKLIDINWNISLIEILALILGKNELMNALWLTEDQYNTLVEEKWINKSKNFVPPFDWANRVTLARFGVPIPIIDWAYFKLMWYLWTDILLDGRINAMCNMLNSTGWCNGQRVELNRAWKSFSANAAYSATDSNQDSLWFYSKFWVTFDDYRYLPELVFKIFAKVWASAKIPLYWWYSIRTPDITIYEYKISNDNLYLSNHQWTTSKIQATDQKVYATRPNITIQTPTIILTTLDWVHNDRTELKLTNNVNTWTWYVYTLDGTTPNCRNSSRITQNQLIKLWKNPTISPLITPKTIQYKVRWCSVLWDGGEMVQWTVMLRNDSLKFLFEWWTKSSDNWRINSYYFDDLKFFYTINWRGPAINDWVEYTNPFNLSQIASQTLQNIFQVSLKWIAYNKTNNTFWQIMSWSYNIKNVYFDPIIKLDNVLWKFWLEVKPYENELFSTYAVYSTDWSKVTCDSNLRIYIQWTQPNSWDMRTWNTTMSFQNGSIPYSTSPINAKTCITDSIWNIVFESDTVSKLPRNNMFLDAWKYDKIKDKLEDGRFAREFMSSLLGGWLDWFLDQEWVMDFMRDTLWGLTDWWVREIFGMFGNWDLTLEWLHDLWSNLDMRNWLSQNQRLWWLRSWISNNKFTQRWVNWIVRNMQNNNLTLEWINNFWNLIQSFSNIPQGPSTFNSTPPSNTPSADTENFCRQSCTKFYGLDQTCYNNCVRNLSTWDFEIDQWSWNEEQNNNNNTQQWQKTSNEKITSTDPYINSKLKEIDSCFTDNYNSHLANINNAINKLDEESKKLEKNDPKYSSYILAIEKLQELKALFIKKYWFMWLTLNTK